TRGVGPADGWRRGICNSRATQGGRGSAFRLACFARLRSRPARAAVAGHEVDDARHDVGAEARAVEDPIMPDRRLHVMNVFLRRDVDAEPVRRLGLAETGNVVVLAFDG